MTINQKQEARSQKPEGQRCRSRFKLSALSFKLLCFFASCFLLLNLSPTTSLAKAKSRKAKITPVSQEKYAQEHPRVRISQKTIDALVKGDLNEAVIELREQPTSPKSLYLLREVTRIVMHNSSKGRPRGSDPHQYYQNLGIAYHNLYLFLKANGYEQEDFAKNAIKFYNKAKSSATPMQKKELKVLMAALFVSNDEAKKADGLMKKIDINDPNINFQMYEYLATYHAAKKDSKEAIEALKAAYRERPDVILTWLAVGDDFYLIKDNPDFVAVLNDWHIARTTKQLELSKPSPASPKLKFAEPAVQFRHPTAPQAQPHYRIVKGKKKVVVVKSHTGSHSKTKKKTITTSKASKKKTSKTKLNTSKTAIQ